MFMTFSVLGAMQGVMIAVAENEAFEKGLAAMPEDQRAEARRRRDESWRKATEERRHRELVEATRSRNHGPLAFLFGFILGRA